MKRILVIKLGALGDVVQGFPAFAAIRAHHRGDHVTLLTTEPYADLARASPWFDAVWSGGRPRWRDLRAVFALARRLRAGRFDRVYDLQGSRRSSRYRLAVGTRAEWSGIARGASHRYGDEDRRRLPAPARHRAQLRIAGIAEVPEPETGWLDADLPGLALPPRFCLLVPGASPTRPGKRWPVERYAALARGLDLPAVVVGGPAEAPLGAAIRQAAPAALDLTGRFRPLTELGALARRAAFAVGNDTGPLHLVAALGCPTLVLFGPESDPALHAPPGPAVAVLRADPIGAIGVEEVRAALAGLVGAGQAQGQGGTQRGP